MAESVHAVVFDLDDTLFDSFTQCVGPARREAAAGRSDFFERDPGPITPYPFALEVLAAVRARARCVLLTAGSPATQRTKVERLGLAGAFHELIYVDSLHGEHKRTALAAWLQDEGLAPASVLVVGDRPEAEIAAALALGCPAIRIRAGEWADEPTPAGVAEVADVRAVLRFL